MREVLDIPTFASLWNTRKAALVSLLGPPGSWRPSTIVNVGSHLSELFLLGRGAGRTQGGVSAAGTVWEALVCYYLNMCFAGTDAVAVRATLVPPPVKSALTVWHGATQVAADVDAMVLHLPDWSKAPIAPDEDVCRDRVDQLFSARFSDAAVVVLACKTNWNDSVQTPMLWNLLYALRSRGIPLHNGFGIGSGGFSLNQLRSFHYAFVTVPTQDPKSIKPDGAPVKRAETMTGGHYWGWPTRSNVSPSLAEFFGRLAGAAALPGPSAVGSALAAEASVATGRIDLTAFDLF